MGLRGPKHMRLASSAGLWRVLREWFHAICSIVSHLVEHAAEETRDVLHNVFQGMSLRLLKVIAPVDWIEPAVQKVLGPLAISDNKAARRQAILVLGDDEVNSVALQIAKCFDDRVGGDNRRVGDHQALEARGREEVRVDGKGGCHDEGGAVEVPEEC